MSSPTSDSTNRASDNKTPFDFLSPTAIGGGFAATLVVVQQIIHPIVAQNTEIIAKLAKLEGLSVRVEYLEKAVLSAKTCPKSQ